MKHTLLVMAAGLGSRFGGVKQLVAVGPKGETFLDLSIDDALAAGFSDVVMVVRSEIADAVNEQVTKTHPNIPVTFVKQDAFGPKRTKPWGTMHAVISANEALDKPFCVINADDYYGPTSFALAVEQLEQVTPDRAATIVFELGKTLPASGSVSRGVCQLTSSNELLSITEAEKCERSADGSVLADGEPMPADTPVSMNMWAFHPGSLPAFTRLWEKFLATNANETTAECQLPTVVSELMNDGLVTVTAAASTEHWIGVTNPQDLDVARSKLTDWRQT